MFIVDIAMNLVRFRCSANWPLDSLDLDNRFYQQNKYLSTSIYCFIMQFFYRNAETNHRIISETELKIVKIELKKTKFHRTKKSGTKEHRWLPLASLGRNLPTVLKKMEQEKRVLLSTFLKVLTTWSVPRHSTERHSTQCRSAEQH